MRISRVVAWGGVALALISFLGCSNPTTPKAEVSTGKPWEKLYIKLEIAGILSNDGDTTGSSMLSFRAGAGSSFWEKNTSFADAIVPLPRGQYRTHTVYGSKELVVTKGEDLYLTKLSVGVKAYNVPNRERGSRVDYLVATIYVKTEEGAEYEVYKQNKVTRKDSLSKPLRVIAEVDFINVYARY